MRSRLGQFANSKRAALENVVGYSAHQPAIFKAQDLKPVKDLKALVGSTVVCNFPPSPPSTTMSITNHHGYRPTPRTL